jgi:DNA-binding NarL/FixJ family response regulator
MAISVLLIDGRKLLREGLRLLLEKYRDIQIAGECDDAGAAMKLVRAIQPQIVLLTCSTMSAGSRALIQQITRGSHASVIVNATHSDPGVAQDVLRAGAAGFLTRECASEELVSALRMVATGGTYISSALAGAVVKKYVTPEPSARKVELSPREREILAHIAEGSTTKQIALTLHVSPKTVETHRRRITRKLGKRSVAELTKHALARGLTSLENCV